MIRIVAVFFSMILILAGCGNPVDDEVFQGTVVNIVDGDTFDVNIQGMGDERVRPIMVDAPEICHQHDPPECEPEPYGEKATEFATDVLLGETVYLEQDESERDQYDRMLFYVYVDEDRMFQEMLLEEGLAEVVVYEPDVRYEEEFFEIQDEAQEEGKGMWGH